MWVKKISKKIPIAFHNGSNSNQKKELEKKKDLAEELEKQFTCLGENAEKYITFTVPMKKSCWKWYKWRRSYKEYISHNTIYW